jgi:hypothetical protein
MDSFEIKVGDSVLTVQRKRDAEIYYIYLKGQNIAVLTPVLTEQGFLWTSDKLDVSYTNILGKLIEVQL